MLTLRAPAKVNLYLHVTGRRDNGYHELNSLVTFADWGDTLRLHAAPDMTLTVTGPFAAPAMAGNENLALRAARAVATATGYDGGVHIELEKNIPVAAGLGGGSADAAAVVRGVMDLWGVVPPDLPGLLLALGADVPVCFAGRSAIMRGIGEDVAPFDRLPALAALLVNPRVACGTADVFAGIRPPYRTAVDFADTDDVITKICAQDNDLTAAACACVPVIADVLIALRDLPGARCARMCGSGATCFALYTDKREAKDAAEILQKAHPEWWVRAVGLGGAA